MVCEGLYNAYCPSPLSCYFGILFVWLHTNPVHCTQVSSCLGIFQHGLLTILQHLIEMRESRHHNRTIKLLTEDNCLQRRLNSINNTHLYMDGIQIRAIVNVCVISTTTCNRDHSCRSWPRTLNDVIHIFLLKLLFREVKGVKE